MAIALARGSTYRTRAPTTRELVQLLDHLTNEVGENEQHPLASLMDVLGVLIEKYEDDNEPGPAE